MTDGNTAQWDLLIRGATVFDGSGDRPAVRDVAVRGTRIAAIGVDIDPSLATEAIDADGLWLVPGLLDVHTHFDLEVELAPGLPEAVRHGTTTAVVSNCSLGLAYGAQRRDGADPIVDCFARVENIPKHVLRKVADRADWRTSAEYLEHLDALPLGANIVPMIPHSMLRIEVMGLQDSVRRDPDARELAEMKRLLELGMEQGYAGFSTDALPFHYLANDPNRERCIPTQYGTFAELKALTGVVRRHGRVWQATPPKDSPLATIRNFLLTSGRLYGRPLKTTVVAALDVHSNRTIVKLGLTLARVLNSGLVRGRFALQALAAPFKTWGEGAVTPLFEEIPEFRRLIETDLEDRDGRRAILDEPQFRERFRAMWLSGKSGVNLARLKRLLRREDYAFSRDLADMTVERCPVPDWHGETLQAVYERWQRFRDDPGAARSDAERAAFGAVPTDVADDADFLLHLLREYDSDLYWHVTSANGDPNMLDALVMNPLLMLGFNDSGAHLTNMAFYDGNLRALQIAQRHGEAAVAATVRRLTREPAEFFGIDAGRLEPGATADVVLIDPDALSAHDAEARVEVRYREEFEHEQLVNRPDGVVTHVWVGGRLAWLGNAPGPALGVDKLGRALRAA